MSGQELLGTNLSNELVAAISFVLAIAFCFGALKLAQVYYDWIDKKERNP